MGWFTTFKEKFPTGKATFLQFRQWVEDVLNTVCNKTQETVTDCYENTRMVFGTYNSPTVTYDLDKGVAEAFINLGFRPKAVSIWNHCGAQAVRYYGENGRWEINGGTVIDGKPCQFGSMIYIEIADNGFYVRSDLKSTYKDGKYVYTEVLTNDFLVMGQHYFVAYPHGSIGIVASDGTFTINS